MVLEYDQTEIVVSLPCEKWKDAGKDSHKFITK